MKPEMEAQYFDGPAFDPALDGKRLTTQLDRVLAVMSDHEWHTIPEIVKKISFPPYEQASEAGVSARLRDLRKTRFGSRKIERRRVGNSGTFQYRLAK